MFHLRGISLSTKKRPIYSMKSANFSFYKNQNFCKMKKIYFILAVICLLASSSQMSAQLIK